MFNPYLLGITALVSGIAFAVGSYKKHIEDLRKDAIESGKEFTEQINSLDEYAEKVRKLRENLDSGNLSETEAYNAKKQLLDIQNQLNETYGKSAEGINLVNGQLDEQIDKIQHLSSVEATKWLNENHEAIQRAEKEMSRTLGENGSFLKSSDGEIGRFQDGPYPAATELNNILKNIAIL